MYMGPLQMSKVDLGDLYALLSVYMQTHLTAERDSVLLTEIAERFKLVQRSSSPDEVLVTIQNPWGAGRKPKYDEGMFMI